MERGMRERYRTVAKEVGKRVFFFQAEDGIRDLVRSRGLGKESLRNFLLKKSYLNGKIYTCAYRKTEFRTHL